MPASMPKTALALSFCALTFIGVAAPASAQAGDSAFLRPYAATASTTGPNLAIGARPVPLAQARLQLASGPTIDCDAPACATLRNAKASTPTRATSQPVSSRLAPTGITEILSSVRGETAALSSTITPSSGQSAMGAQQFDIVLDKQTMAALDPDVQAALTGDLTKLASMLEPLATAAGPGALADVLTTIQDIANDPGSRPFMRIVQQPTTLEIDAKPRANVINGAAQVLLFPTASNHGLIEIEIAASTLTAESPAGQSATGTIAPGNMQVVLLPGLAGSVPAAVGPKNQLAGTPVAQILKQIPKAAAGVLGPNFNATDSALVLDAETGGLKMEVNASTERACWFDTNVLETCVESGVGQRNVSHNGSGVGIIARPARVGLLRQNLVVGLHESQIGVNTDPAAKPTPQASTHDLAQPLPKTGTNLPPLWALILTALGSIGVLTALRPRR